MTQATSAFFCYIFWFWFGFVNLHNICMYMKYCTHIPDEMCVCVCGVCGSNLLGSVSCCSCACVAWMEMSSYVSVKQVELIALCFCFVTPFNLDVVWNIIIIPAPLTDHVILSYLLISGANWDYNSKYVVSF